jgi:ABC-type polysaccharide/polyol phosphate export permease
MFQGIISALVIAAISSIAIIAYRHPKGYARLYWFLMPLSSVVFGYAMGENFGFSKAEAQMIPFLVHPVDWQRVNAALEGQVFPFHWMIYSQVFAWIYLTVLLFLHRIIGDRAAESRRPTTRATK